MNALAPDFGPLFRRDDRVAASDLTAWQRSFLFAEVRHFRGLHRLCGVASGLIVRVSQDEIAVSPGVAFDAIGRPLVLEQERRIPLASARTGDWIILRGEEPETQSPNEEIPAPQVCNVALRAAEAEGPPFVTPWEVPLARVTNPAAPGTLDNSNRAAALPAFRRPFAATGVCPTGTPCRTLGTARGWEVWVDAKSAGFLPPQITPGGETEASAPLLGSPVFVATVGRPSAADAKRLRTGQVLVDGDEAESPHAPWITMRHASDKGFFLRVEYGVDRPDLAELGGTPLEVRWTGFEQRPAAGDSVRSRKGSEDVGMRLTGTGKQLRWPAFRDDERLQASDLGDVQETIRELQWLHNRSLHDWGVAEGCSVVAQTDGRSILVEAGHAIDVEGREVILPEPVLLSTPAQKPLNGSPGRKTWWVAATYFEAPTPRDADAAARMQGVPPRRLPKAIVRWRDPEEQDADQRLAPGYDIILGSVEIAQGKVLAITPQGRRSAIPSKLPLVFAGREPISPKSLPDGEEWFDASIDTTAAAFSGTPQYLFTIEWPNSRPPVFVDAQPFAKDPTPTGFKVALPRVLVHSGSSHSRRLAWFWVTMALLLAAAICPILLKNWKPFGIPDSMWIGTFVAFLAALPPSLAAMRRPINPSRTSAAASSDPKEITWESFFVGSVKQWFDRMAPPTLFHDANSGRGISRWWLILMAGLPIPAVWAQLWSGPIGVAASSLLMLVAALPSILTAWQQSNASPPSPPQGPCLTIAWVGIEV